MKEELERLRVAYHCGEKAAKIQIRYLLEVMLAIRR